MHFSLHALLGSGADPEKNSNGEEHELRWCPSGGAHRQKAVDRGDGRVTYLGRNQAGKIYREIVI